MVKSVKSGKESIPYRVSYRVFKQFQEEKSFSPEQFTTMGLENIAYLHYLAVCSGYKGLEEECRFKSFEQFEDFLDEDFSILAKMEEVFVTFLPDQPDEAGK